LTGKPLFLLVGIAPTPVVRENIFLEGGRQGLFAGRERVDVTPTFDALLDPPFRKRVGQSS